MTGAQRFILAAAIALIGAGLGGVATHSGPTQTLVHRPVPPTATTRPPSTTAASTSPTTTLPAGPAPTSSDLAGGMITPTDMGGYYRISADFAASFLASSPCLALLEPSPGQAGRAVTGLLGPDEYSIPTIVEAAVSYPGAASDSAFGEASRAVGACPAFGTVFGSARVSVPLAAYNIPPVGDADQVWQGRFTYEGAQFTFQIGLVRDGQTLLALVFIDSVPRADAIMGNFASTLSLAIGKLA
jgi:hypothetical protein